MTILGVSFVAQQMKLLVGMPTNHTEEAGIECHLHFGHCFLLITWKAADDPSTYVPVAYIESLMEFLFWIQLDSGQAVTSIGEVN